MLCPTSARRERLLIYGIEGTGKSYAWCKIAAWARRTNSPAHFYVMDSDTSAEAMADEFPNFYDNTTVYDVWEWEEYQESLDDARRESDPARNDWLIVDTADRPLSAVQDWYVRNTITADVENWVAEQGRQLQQASTDDERKAARAHPLSGDWGMNWFYINQVYSKWFVPIVRWRGHVLITAHEKKLSREGEFKDSKELVAIYDRYGVRPEGQKGLSLPMHTILRATDNFQRGKHDRRMTAVKDRARDQAGIVDVPIEDFAMDYLVPVGKWQT